MLFTFSLSLQGGVPCKLLILVKSLLFDVKWHNDYLNWETAFHPRICCFMYCWWDLCSLEMVVVISVISRGLCLHTDLLRDLKQKLLSYLVVTQPGDVCRTGEQVQMCRMEVRFSAALCWCSADDVRIAPTCWFTPPATWQWGMDPHSGHWAKLLHVSWAAVTVPDC